MPMPGEKDFLCRSDFLGMRQREYTYSMAFTAYIVWYTKIQSYLVGVVRDAANEYRKSFDSTS